MTQISRVQVLSVFMARLCYILLFVIPLATAFLWINFDLIGPMVFAQLNLVYDPDRIDYATRIWGFLASMIPGGLWMYGLFHLRHMFAECAGERYFSALSVNSFRKFSWVAFVQVFAVICQSSLVSVILTYHQPAGQKQLVVSISSHQLYALFVGLLLVVISHILAEGKNIADDNASFL